MGWVHDVIYDEPMPADEDGEGAEDSSLFDKAVGVGASALGTLGTVLDTAARPVRTALHTGDYGQAWDSIFDPAQASSVQDLRGDLGIGDVGTAGDSFTRDSYNPLDWDWGDAADVAIDTGIGMATDPTTYLGVGLAKQAGQTAASAGRHAAAQLARGGAKGAIAREFAEETGKRLTKSMLAPGVAPGVERTLAGRLAAGEQSLLSLRLPFVGDALGLGNVDVLGKAAAPVVKAIEDRASVAAEIFGQTGLGRKAIDIAGWTRDMILNPFAGDAIGESARIAQAYGQSEMLKLQRSVVGIRKELSEAGVDYTRYAEPIHKIMTSVDKVGEIRVKEFNEGWAALEGLTESQKDRVVELARQGVKVGEQMRGVLGREGIMVEELGSSAVKKLDDARAALGEIEPGTPAYIKTAQQVAELEHAVANTPNWVPMVATDDFMRQTVKVGRKIGDIESPDIRLKLMRKFQEKGRPLTAIEANKAIAEKGTEALGFEVVRGKLPLGKAVRALWDGDPAQARAASEALGEAFDVDPLAAIESKAAVYAHSLEKAKMLNGIRNLYGNTKSATVARRGWVDASDLGEQLKGVRLPRDVYNRIQRDYATMRDPNEMLKFVPMVREFNRAWKAASTLPFPAFHMRNKIGNWWRRGQEGAFDLTPAGMEAEVAVHQALAQFGLGKSPAELNKIAVNVGEEVWGGSQLVERAIAEGVIGAGQWAVEVTPELAKRKGLMHRALEAEFKGVSAKKIAQYVEDSDRLASFVAFMRKGNSPEMAAHLVEKTLFNYRNVGRGVDFLRQSGIAPFAAWAAKNIPAQIVNLIQKPGDFVALLHAKRAIENGVPGVSEEDLPQCARERFGIAYRRNADGGVDFITADGVIPSADLPQLADPAAFIKQYLGPMPRAAIETMLNYDLFTKRKIEQFNGQTDLLRIPFFPGGGTQTDPTATNMAREMGGRFATSMEQMGKAANEGDAASAGKAILSAFAPVRSQTSAPDRIANADVAEAREALSAAKRGLKYWTGKNEDMTESYKMAVERLERQLRKAQGKRAQIPVP